MEEKFFLQVLKRNLSRKTSKEKTKEAVRRNNENEMETGTYHGALLTSATTLHRIGPRN
jgi:hypothetical protein